MVESVAELRVSPAASAALTQRWWLWSERAKDAMLYQWTTQMVAAFEDMNRKLLAFLEETVGPVRKQGPADVLDKNNWDSLLLNWQQSRVEPTVLGLYAHAFRATGLGMKQAIGISIPLGRTPIDAPAYAMVRGYSEAEQWALQHAAERAALIRGYTGTQIAERIATGIERGYPVREIAYGSARSRAEGFTPIRDWLDETYRHRAVTVARTESGMAFNMASNDRFGAAGVQEVKVLDDNGPGSCQPCKDADGQTWTLAQAQERPLEHPNCRRAFAPVIPAYSSKPAPVPNPPPKPPPEPRPRGGGRPKPVVQPGLPVVTPKPEPVVAPKVTGPNTPGTFTPKGTAQGAVEWGKKTYPEVNWGEMKGLTEDMANQIVAGVDKVLADNPQLIANGRKLYIGIGQPSAMKGNVYAHCISGANGSVVELNGRYFLHDDRLIRQLRMDVAMGWHPPGCDTPQSVVVHELGHAVWNEAMATNSALASQVSASGFGTVSSTVKLWNDHFIASARTAISRYATSNEREHFAEAFASHYCTKAAAQPEVARSMGLLLEAIGPTHRVEQGAWSWVGSLPIEERESAKAALEELAQRIGLSTGAP